ncbi:MAG: hypothetical protein V1862_03375, partial [Methanobacteriota archaeon]
MQTIPDSSNNTLSLSDSGAVHLQSSSEITGTGTIIYQDFEGGFFGVISDDGHRYLPPDIPVDLQVNGTRVSFIFKPITDKVTFYMWGEQVEKILLHALHDEENTNSSVPFIEYEKAGGVASSYETLRIFSNQQGKVKKWNHVQVFNLTNEEMKNMG